LSTKLLTISVDNCELLTSYQQVFNIIRLWGNIQQKNEKISTKK